MANAQELLKDIEKRMNNWDERSQFKMKGVGNLSFSDMESIKLYAQEYLRQGNINNLMTPLGGVGEVLFKYGIKKSFF